MHKSVAQHVIQSAKRIGVIILVLILSVIFLWTIISAIISSNVPHIEPVDLSIIPELELPNSKIIAIGTPTHGNAEPYKLTLSILNRIYEEYGAVTLILEELVGDAEIINKQHSYTNVDGRKLGFYSVYDNNEMSDILNWLNDTNQRIYGIDIQSISSTTEILNSALEKLGFKDAERVLHLTGSSQSAIEQNESFLKTLEEYIEQQRCKGIISEQYNAYLLHLINCIKMYYKYELSGQSFEMRDKLMAKNAEWVIDYENKYYNNDHAVLLASNGHIIKCNWSYNFLKDNYISMGSYLALEYNEDYYAILIDARQNNFDALYGNQSKKCIFHIENDQLDSYVGVGGIDIAFINSDNLPPNEGQNWKLTIVGNAFTTFRSLRDDYYTTHISFKDSCNMLLCFKTMTPVSYPLNS